MRVTILGGGIAGLSAGWVLSENDIDVTILEKENSVGGMARSFTRDGYIYDLGGHRFFTKNDKLVDVLKQLLGDNLVTMPRKSSIYMKKKFFEYPPKPLEVLIKMPPATSVRIIMDYLTAMVSHKIRPRPDYSFEDWVTNRFGKTMYDIYFGTYTEKVWGMSPKLISADWAAQRIHVVNLFDALKNAVIKSKKGPRTYAREFYYPREGGIVEISKSLEERIVSNGGRILTGSEVESVSVDENTVRGIRYAGGEEKDIGMVISTVPMTNLVGMIKPGVPERVSKAASKLGFKATIFVYIALNRPEISDDTWMYFPEDDILANRINEVNKFGPNNTPNGKCLLCIDINCNYDDKLWNMPDDKLVERCVSDFVRIGLFDRSDVERGFVERENYSYPLYDMGYKENLNAVLDYLNGIENLRCIGRNGLFRYNNMDHSMEMGLVIGQRIAAQEHEDVHVLIDEIASEKDYFG